MRYLLPLNRITAMMAVSLIPSAALAQAMGGDDAFAFSQDLRERWEAFADEAWSLPVLYDNPDNPVIQKVSLGGRYHGQYYATDTNAGDVSGWENRRAWLGLNAQFRENLEFKVRFESDLDGGRLFDNMKEAYFEWEPREDLLLVVGKQKPLVTQEYPVSSKRILTLERSLLVGQTVPARAGGVRADYAYGDWVFRAGVYSGELSDDWAVPQFGGGVGTLASVGYSGLENSVIRFDWFHNDGDARNNAFEPYEHILSLNSANQWDRFGLDTDLIFAEGGGNTPSAYGLVLIPHYDIKDWLQVVFRYQYAGGDGEQAIRLRSRYERPSVQDGSGTRGDDYHAFYGGLNIYLHGHKLKIMNGVEYSTLDGAADFDGWTFLSGVRLYF